MIPQNKKIYMEDISKFEALSSHMISDKITYLGKTNERQYLPLSNGKMSAVIRADENIILMQIHHADASPSSAINCARIKIVLPDNMKKVLKQELDFNTGNVTIYYEHEKSITFFSRPKAEVFGICSKNISEQIGIECFSWITDVTEVYSKDIMSTGSVDVEAWKNVKVHENNNILIIEKGICKNYGFNLGVLSDDYSNKELNATGYNFKTNSTVWVAVTTVYGGNIGDLSKKLISASSEGCENIISENSKWWDEYFSRSYLSIYDNSPTAAYLQKLYYFWLYLAAGEGYAKQQIQFVSGAFNWHQDKMRWTTAYWHFNQRSLYNSFFANNRLELLDSYINFHLNNVEQYRENAKVRFGVSKGIFAPEVVAHDGNFAYFDKEGDNYTTKITSTTLEIANAMYKKFAYECDKDYLNKIFSFMDEAVEFFLEILIYEDNMYKIKGTNAHEDWWVVDNSTPDQAGIRTLFSNVLEAVEILGISYSKKATVKNVLEKLEPIAQNESYILPHSTKNYERKCQYNLLFKENYEHTELETIFPFFVLDYDDELFQKAINTFKIRYDLSSWTWCQDAIYAARLGLGHDAYFELRLILEKIKASDNYIADDKNCYLEGNAIIATALAEMHLQSHGNLIRLFPAVPDLKDYSASFTLLAQGNFIVSSAYEKCVVSYIKIHSKSGNFVRILNPWNTDIKINEKIYPKNEIIEFQTQKDETYLISKIVGLKS